MNLIATCERLRELEQKATPGDWRLLGKIDFQIVADSDDFYINFEDSDINDPQFITDMRNAAPDMLAVLGGFQPGDAGTLVQIEYILMDMDCGHLVEEIECVRRLHEMARQMEADR